MESITVRLKETTRQRLDDTADEHSVSRSEYVRELIVSDLKGDADTGEHQARAERLRDELDSLRDEHDELRETRMTERERLARLEAENERLQSDLTRVRDERDSAQARYHEAHTKVKLHNSERDGALTRLKDWLH